MPVDNHSVPHHPSEPPSRLTERWRRILLGPAEREASELDGRLDDALALDDERDVRRGAS